jgi:hypothetical protein
MPAIAAYLSSQGIEQALSSQGNHGGEARVVLWQLQALFIGLRIIPTPFIMSSNITSRECAT